MSEITESILLEAKNLASPAIEKVSRDLGGFGDEHDRTTRKIAGGQGIIDKLGQSFTSGLGIAAGIVSLNAFGNAFGNMVSGVVGGAAKVEQVVANISTIKPDIDTTQVAAKLNEISTRVPQTAKELGDGLYNIFSSLELSTEDGLKLLDTFAKGAVGASTDALTFGTAAMGVMNAYGKETNTAEHISDVFFNTVKLGVVTGQELAQNLGLVTQSAKMAGVDLDELGGFIAGVTKEGGPAAQNINNLNNLLLKFNTIESSKEFHKLGIATVDLTGNLRPAVDVLTDLKAKTEGMTDAAKVAVMQKIFPDLQARAGAAVILDQLDFVKRAIEENKTSAGSAEAAFEKMNATFESQLKLLENSIASMEATLGAKLLPAITPIIKAFAEGLPAAMDTAGAAFNETRDKAQTALQDIASGLARQGREWAGWAAGAGESGRVVDHALAGTTGVVQSLQFLLQGNFQAAWKTAGAAMSEFGTAADHIRQIFEDNKAPIMAVVAAAAALAVGLGFVVPAVAAVSAAFGTLAAVAGGLYAANAIGGMPALFGSIVTLLGGPVTIAIAGVALALGGLTFAWVNNWGDIQGTTQKVIADLQKWFGELSTELANHGAVDDLKGAWNDLKDVGALLWGMVRDFFTPTQKEFNKTLSGGSDSADKSAAAAAGSIKELTTAVRDFAADLKVGLQFMKDLETALNSVQQTSRYVSSAIHDAFHNAVITAFNEALSPLQKIVDGIKEFENLIRNTFHINIDIPGVQGLNDTLDRLRNWSSNPASPAGGPGGIPNLSAMGTGNGAVALGGTDYRLAAYQAAVAAGIDPNIFMAQINQESGFNPNVRSPAGAIGIAQYMPGTARSQGVDPTDALASLDAAARYDAQLLQKYGGHWESVLASYNAGEGAVERYGGVPPYAETQDYVRIIMGAAARAGGSEPYGPNQGAGVTSEFALGDPATDPLALAAGQRRVGYARSGAAVGAPGSVAADITDDAGVKAVRSITRSWDKLMEDTAAGYAKIDVKEARDFGAAETKLGPGGTDVARANRDADNAIADLTAQRDITRRIAAEELVYNRKLQDQATEHTRQIEDANVLVNQQLANVALVHQRSLQDDQIVHNTQLAQQATIHQRALQDEQSKVSEQLANVQLVHQRALQDAQAGPNDQLQAQATIHSRTLQDTEVQYQFQRNLSKATTDAQRDQIRQAHNDELENIAHQRQLQDQENAYQRGLQVAALVAQRSLQDAEIKYQNDQRALQMVDQRKLADTESTYQMGLAMAEMVYQRGLQDQEIIYQQGIAADALKRQRADQDAAMVYARGLEDQAIVHRNGLEDEAFQRQVDHINRERAQRIADIAVEFAARKQAILDEAAASRLAFKLTQDAKAADLIEAATENLSKYGAAADPVLNKMKSDWAGVQVTIATAIADVDNNQMAMQTVTAETATAIGVSTGSISDYFGTTNEAASALAEEFGISFEAADAIVNDSGSVAKAVLGEDIPGQFVLTDLAVMRFADKFKISWDQARAILESGGRVSELVMGTTIPNAAGDAGKALAGDDGLLSKAGDAMVGMQGLNKSAADSKQPMGAAELAAKALARDGLNVAKDATAAMASMLLRLRDGLVGDGDYAGHGLIDAVGALIKKLSEIPRDIVVTITTRGSSSASAGGGNVGGGDVGGDTGGDNGDGGDTGGGDSDASPFPGHIGESGPGGKYNNPSTGKPYDHALGGVTTGRISGTFGENGPEAIIPLGDYLLSHKSTAPAAPVIDYDLLAQAVVRAFQAAGSLTVGVDTIHSALIQKQRRSGSLGLR